jgi:hypothetical protein
MPFAFTCQVGLGAFSIRIGQSFVDGKRGVQNLQRDRDQRISRRFVLAAIVRSSEPDDRRAGFLQILSRP